MEIKVEAREVSKYQLSKHSWEATELLIVNNSSKMSLDDMHHFILETRPKTLFFSRMV